VNYGWLIYKGMLTKEVLGQRKEIFRALGDHENTATSILTPARDLVIFLVHAKNLKTSDLYELSNLDRSLFFYSGQISDEKTTECIKNTSFLTPDSLKRKLNISNGTVDREKPVEHEKIKGQFCGCFFEFEGTSSKSIIIFTDWLGIHPAFDYTSDKGIVITNFSEGVIATGLHDSSLDIESIGMFLSVGTVLNDRTFLSELRRLPANAVTIYNCINNDCISRRGNGISEIVPTAIAENDLSEKIYWDLRSIVRRQCKNFTLPITIKLSGGSDSRFLLHCLMQEKIPFNALTYWYLSENEFDVVYAGELAKQFNFIHIVQKLPLYSISNATLKEVNGRGRISRALDDPTMSGNFAALAIKGRGFTDGLTIAEMVRSLPAGHFFKRYPREDFVDAYKVRMADFPGGTPKQKAYRFKVYDAFAGYAIGFPDPNTSRPSHFAKGNRLLPFFDSSFLALNLEFPGCFPKDWYDKTYVFDHYMQEMTFIPRQHRESGNIQLKGYDEQMEKRDFEFRRKHIDRIVQSNETFACFVPDIDLRKLPYDYINVLFILGIWLENYAQRATIKI
jgi:hypothetical protein